MPPEDLTEDAKADLIEQHPCPRCSALPGSPCRTHLGRVATTYHTGRYGHLARLRSGTKVKIPTSRRPGKIWTACVVSDPGPAVSERAGDRVGYARVSTRDQDLDGQVETLRAAGCVRIYAEKITTRAAMRPEYLKALESLRPNDILTVTKLDRLGRSMVELILAAQDLETRGMRLEILTGALAGVYNPHGMGKLLFAMFAAMAEAEREFIHERTMEGLAAAEAKGHHGGRPAAVSDDDLAVALSRRAKGESVTSIAAVLKVGRSTLYRALETHGAVAEEPSEGAELP
jgi:DNA invertase Pin-like site-specific DNA recombinase